MSSTPAEESTRFADRVVVVTGALGGIGESTVRAFRGAGATVIGLDVAAGRAASGDDGLEGVDYVACDLTDSGQVDEVFAEIGRDHGKVDVVVNNAAIGAKGTVETATDEDWSQVFDLNVYGVARVSRAALPLLRASDAGAVVNVASVNALIGTPVRAVYSASKGAVAALTRAMAADLLADRIRVNAVYPGPVLTAVTGRYDEDREAAIELMRERQPLGRLIDADEIASSILYLSDPLHRSLTGMELRYDGSLSEVVNVGTA